jgi:dienelactone hydrolase
VISDDSLPSTRSVVSARDLAYDGLGLPLAGVLCWDEAQRGPRPGILLIHGGAGLDVHAREQARRYAGIGFCFGGMAALALARAGTDPAGTDPAGVVSIHGSLATTRPAVPGAVAARILVCHGASDPHVPPGDVTAFAEEMNQANADWELVMYGQALHGFTHRDAVPGAPGAMPGVAYDRLADERSFAAARAFLADVLGA